MPSLLLLPPSLAVPFKCLHLHLISIYLLQKKIPLVSYSLKLVILRVYTHRHIARPFQALGRRWWTTFDMDVSSFLKSDFCFSTGYDHAGFTSKSFDSVHAIPSPSTSGRFSSSLITTIDCPPDINALKTTCHAVLWSGNNLHDLHYQHLGSSPPVEPLESEGGQLASS